MKTLKPFVILVCFLGLSACGSPEVGAAKDELKSAAKAAVGDAVGEASAMAAGLLDTKNACLVAGQSEAFCGCLSTELGPNLDDTHMATLKEALKTGLKGDIGEALKGASNVDPETRSALAKCGTRAAISGAMGN
jgi:hypothetical protein